MDDRNKRINELEQRKREQGIFLDEVLVRLGEDLFGRTDGLGQENTTAFEELIVYRRLKNDIAASEASIQTIEEQIRRFRELEESIENKEQADSAVTKELALVYGRLGKLLLDVSDTNGWYTELCAPYREQAHALLTKVISLEERLSGLEGKDGGNVLTWIGKGAQGLVLRSFLTKAQESLEQLYRNVGERYGRQDTVKLTSGETEYQEPHSENVAIADLCAEIEGKLVESRMLQGELAELREERRTISGSFNTEGSPLKQIQALKNHIAHIWDELKTLYRRVGAEAAAADTAGRRIVIDSLLTPEDKENTDSAAQAVRLIHDYESEIQKLQASLSIDEEKAKIEKYRKMIQDKRDKITLAEKSVAEFEGKIRVSEASIEKLANLL